ncbi:MAG: 4-(cytidine 5'-diphospho)-2-C-methyl-D-erythritol kinase [Bacteroidota bacterium]
MSIRSVVLYPNAKINLGLIIKGKRPDGYHLLETVFIPVEHLRDRLEISPLDHEGVEMTLSGLAVDGPVEANLCWKAYQLLKTEFPGLPGVRIHLEKHIPLGAGLGGGSSDAAHTLMGLSQLFALDISLERLAILGAELGADVPFFLYNKPLFAKGIGTEFEPIDLDWKFEIRLVFSPIHSSTPAAYKNLPLNSLNLNRDLQKILSIPIADWKDNLPNDLELPVFEQYPELNETKEQLYREGAVYAAMSGSGSAVYGLF